MLAIIPARGGSKGIPGKNIKELNGKPLIGYTIEAALNAKNVDRVIVSTDDPAIAEIGKKFNAEVPFFRPTDLATDVALAVDNYIYTIERLKREEGAVINEFIVLQPTSPLRTSYDIDEAIDLYHSLDANSVISYYKAAHPPAWAKSINDDLSITEYFKMDVENINRQDIAEAYMPNGALYVFNYDELKNSKSFWSDRSYAYLMPAERSFDIDTQLDFDLAELYIKYKLNESN